MANVVTEERCLDFLHSDLSRRKFELTRMLHYVNMVNSGEARESLMRSGVVMLYAHWEGFVKSAAEAYLEHVAARITRAPYMMQQLSAHLVSLILWKRVCAGALEKMTPIERFIHVSKTHAAEDKSQIVPFNHSAIVKTESNLTAKTFRTLSATIDVVDEQLISAALVLQGSIVEYRMRIAHGNFIAPFVPEDYKRHHETTIATLQGFHDVIATAVRAKKYLA